MLCNGWLSWLTLSAQLGCRNIHVSFTRESSTPRCTQITESRFWAKAANGLKQYFQHRILQGSFKFPWLRATHIHITSGKVLKLSSCSELCVTSEARQSSQAACLLHGLSLMTCFRMSRSVNTAITSGFVPISGGNEAFWCCHVHPINPIAQWLYLTDLLLACLHGWGEAQKTTPNIKVWNLASRKCRMDLKHFLFRC